MKILTRDGRFEAQVFSQSGAYGTYEFVIYKFLVRGKRQVAEKRFLGCMSEAVSKARYRLRQLKKGRK